MEYVLSIISMLYGLLMALATIKVIVFSEHPLLFTINLVGSLFMLLYLIDYRLLYVGVSILLVASILNGAIILNKLTPTHIIVRLLFSLVLICSNYLIHNFN